MAKITIFIDTAADDFSGYDQDILRAAGDLSPSRVDAPEVKEVEHVNILDEPAVAAAVESATKRRGRPPKDAAPVEAAKPVEAAPAPKAEPVDFDPLGETEEPAPAIEQDEATCEMLNERIKFLMTKGVPTVELVGICKKIAGAGSAKRADPKFYPALWEAFGKLMPE